MSKIANVLLAVLILVLLAVASTVTIIPAVTGLTPVSIVAGSMTPTYPYGTLVLINPDAEPTVGSVVTAKYGPATPVTHRVIAIEPDPSGNNVQYVLQGDANVTPDERVAYPDEVVGVVESSIPAAGMVVGLMGQLPVQVFFGTICIGLYWLSNQKRAPKASELMGEQGN